MKTNQTEQNPIGPLNVASYLPQVVLLQSYGLGVAESCQSGAGKISRQGMLTGIVHINMDKNSLRLRLEFLSHMKISVF